MSDVDLVTGSFGYTGSFIAERLLARGRRVRTLTRRPAGDHRLAGRIETFPLAFDDPVALTRALEGVHTLYNTYWMRFPRGKRGFEQILEETRLLLDAARAAGVGRVVHFSVSNASLHAPTEYFRAKARSEDIVRSSGILAAIVRPTLLFGRGDILINNLAWTLRRVPVFGIVRPGDYLVQPVRVADVADLAVGLGVRGDEPTVDAAGPERYRFDDLVHAVRDAVRARSRIVMVPASVALLASRALGLLVRDVVLTRDEVTELTAGLLVSHDPPTCALQFSTWLEGEAGGLGRRWASELARNY